MVFNIFGQNRLGISLSIYLGQKDPLRLHLTKESFFERATIFHFFHLWHISFLRHPVWWKYILNKNVHVLGTNGSQGVPTNSGTLLGEGNYIDWSKISQFLAHYMAFSIFRTPCTLCPWISGHSVIKQITSNYLRNMRGLFSYILL